MKSKLGILVSLLFISIIEASGQTYVDAGVRISKFNHGITGKVLSLNENTNVYSGMEVFIFRSEIGLGKRGYGIKPFYLKQLNIHKNGHETEIYFLGGIGAHVAIFRHGYYKLINDKQGIYKYPGDYIFNFGFDFLVGFEWQSYDWPVSLALTCNPWIDLVNKGPEWMDINFSIKYAFPQHTAEEKKQRKHD